MPWFPFLRGMQLCIRKLEHFLLSGGYPACILAVLQNKLLGDFCEFES